MGIWALYNPKLPIWPLIGLPDLAGDQHRHETTTNRSVSAIGDRETNTLTAGAEKKARNTFNPK
jgi:hypothetical protein